jgi:hypothetical protein
MTPSSGRMTDSNALRSAVDSAGRDDANVVEPRCKELSQHRRIMGL